MNDVSAAFADSDLCTVFAGLVSDCGDEQRLAKLRLDALELKKWICVQTAPLQLELRRVHREMAELENALKTARNVATDTPASTQGGSHPTDEAENASLQSAATSSEAFTVIPTPSSGTGTPSLQRSPTFPDPEIFDGEYSEGLKVFMDSLRWKFKFNADHFVSEQHKLAYAFARMGLSIRSILGTYVATDGTIDLANVEALFSVLSAKHDTGELC